MMIADFFTKPLQGTLYKRLKAVIMGDIDVLTFMNMPSGSKERVGGTILEPNGQVQSSILSRKTDKAQTQTMAKHLNVTAKQVTYADAVRRRT